MNVDARRNLIYILRGLADPEYQNKIWINNQLPVANYESSMEMILADLEIFLSKEGLPFLLDETFKDREEMSLADTLLNNIESLDQITINFENESEIIKSEEWKKVVESAQRLYTLMTNGHNPAGYFEDIKKGWIPNDDLLK
jgi:hypothetical protein